MKVASPPDEKRAHEKADPPNEHFREAVPPPGLNPETAGFAILTAGAAPSGRPAQAIVLDAIHRMYMGAS
jgi:hypothetical protein